MFLHASDPTVSITHSKTFNNPYRDTAECCLSHFPHETFYGATIAELLTEACFHKTVQFAAL